MRTGSHGDGAIAGRQACVRCLALPLLLRCVALVRLFPGMPTPAKTPTTRIFIARHGQTVSNREGRFCGHSETDLTPLGEAQARTLGETATIECVIVKVRFAGDHE